MPNVLPILQLRTYIPDSSHIIEAQPIEMAKNLSYGTPYADPQPYKQAIIQ